MKDLADMSYFKPKVAIAPSNTSLSPTTVSNTPAPTVSIDVMNYLYRQDNNNNNHKNFGETQMRIMVDTDQPPTVTLGQDGTYAGYDQTNQEYQVYSNSATDKE